MSDLALSQARREEAIVDAEIEAYIDRRIASVKLAAPISSTAKVKLRGILKKYAKDKTPFRSCVRDNMKRFGPGRAEAVCATLKDEIKGNKTWRKGGAKMSDAALVIDGDVLVALNAISDVDLESIFMGARAIEEGKTPEAMALSTTAADELRRWGDGLALEEKS